MHTAQDIGAAEGRQHGMQHGNQHLIGGIAGRWRQCQTRLIEEQENRLPRLRQAIDLPLRQPGQVTPQRGQIRWLRDQGPARGKELPGQGERAKHLPLHGHCMPKPSGGHGLLEGEESRRAGRFQASRGLLQALQQGRCL
jgi:hypothetical protein